MGLETTPLPDFMDLYVFQESQVKARIGWQSLTTREYLKSGKYGLIGGINLVDGKIDWDSIPYVSKWRYDQDKFIQLQQNDVLISKDGTIGKIAFVDSLPFPSTLNSGVYVIRPKEGKYDPSFMYHLLNSFIFEDFIEKLSAGSTISHLYQKDLKHFLVQIPSSLDAQKAIAEALSDIDELISISKKLLSKKVNVVGGLVSELVSGHYFNKIGAEFHFNSIKNLGIEVKKGELITEKTAIEGGVPVIAGGLTAAYFHNSYNRTGTTVTISASGANAGFVNIWRQPIWASDCSTINESSVFDVRYLYYILKGNQENIYRSQYGGAQPHVRPNEIEKIVIPWTEKRNQEVISDLLDDFSNEIRDLETSIQKYEWLKQAMMHDLLTGKVRLV